MRLPFLVLLPLLLAGCPDDRVKTPDASTPIESTDHGASSFCDAFAAASCARMAECGSADPAALDACGRAQFRQCERSLGRYVRAGAVELTENAESICSDLLAAASCLQASKPAWLTDCFYAEEVRRPAAETGERCQTNSDCVSGVCGAFDDETCTVCAPYPALGEPCDFCDPKTSFCYRDLASGSSACTPLLSDGEACRRRDECASGICNSSRTCGAAALGESCWSYIDCGPTAFCKGAVPEPTTPGICTERSALGAACTREPWDPSGGCIEGAFCLDGFCAAPPYGSLPVGAECVHSLQCAVGNFCMGAFGGIEMGICSPLPVDGEPCLDEGEWCTPSTVCILHADARRLCLSRKPIGAACTNVDERLDDCQVGLACFEDTNGAASCRPLAANGAACELDRQCLSHRCTNGLCEPPGGKGASCDYYSACIEGCVSSGEDPPVCEPVCFPPAE